jgi:hypothetical protein
MGRARSSQHSVSANLGFDGCWESFTLFARWDHAPSRLRAAALPQAIADASARDCIFDLARPAPTALARRLPGCLPRRPKAIATRQAIRI